MRVASFQKKMRVAMAALLVCECEPITSRTASMKRTREEEGLEEEQEQAAPVPAMATSPALNP
jgi:hypothetical protein